MRDSEDQTASRAPPDLQHITLSATADPDEQLLRALEEYHQVLDRGAIPKRTDLLARYADIADELADCLDNLDFIHGVAPLLNREAYSEQLDAPQQHRPSAALGDFRILREIGRGGMGVVYEAEQISLHRRVALKVLPFAAVLDPRQLQRFKNEALAAAQLKHPHIVGVITVGCERAVHFYAMEYIEGETLAAIIDQLRTIHHPHVASEVPSGSPAPRPAAPETAVDQAETRLLAALSTDRSLKSAEHFRSIAKLGVEVAEALDHAHQHGIVHRDVKPSNLMLDTTGKVWVTDFGLAQFDTDSQLTMTGDVMGTLRYMSPEQALGKRGVVDQRSDVYSLGATLYELLTLEPVHAGSDRQELFQKIATEEPRPLKSLNRDIPKDLETIVLKSLEKEPGDRYPTAADMAGDLQRFLNHEPIHAKRPSTVERMTKWTRRHTAATLAILSVVGALIVLVVGLVVHSVRIGSLNASLAQTNSELGEALDQSRQNEERAIQGELHSQRLLYAADIKFADQALRKGDVRQVAELLARHLPQEGKAEHRGVEWHYLKSLIEVEHIDLPGHEGDANSVSYSPAGRWIATAGDDGIIRILDAATHEVRITLDAGDEWVTHVAFSPDGRTVAATTGAGMVHLWDLLSIGEPRIIHAHPGVASAVLFSHDGARLVTCGSEPTIRIWDTQTGKPIGTHEGHTRGSEALALVPGEGILGSASDDGTVRLWDLNTDSELSVWRASHHRMVSIAFSADGALVVAGGVDNTVQVWDRITGEQVFLARHDDPVVCVNFAPSGKWIAAGDRGGIIRFWPLSSSATGADSNQNRDAITWTAHAGRVYSVDFSPDGQFLASAGEDGNVKIWSPFSRTPRRQLEAHGRRFDDMAFTADSRFLLTVDTLGELLVWDAALGTCTALLARHHRGMTSLAISLDGTSLAASDVAGTILLWDLTSRLPPVVWADSRRELTGGLEFSPDGATLAFYDRSHPVHFATAHLWDLHSGRAIPGFESLPGLNPTFSPDGTTLAFGVDNDVEVWEVAKGEKLLSLRGHTSTVAAIAFSPDGRLLASASFDRRVKLWNLADGTERHSLGGHEDKVVTLLFSPDGRSLLTAGHDGMLKVWQVDSGQELMEFDRESGLFGRITMSRDGRWLACCVDAGIVIHDLGHQSVTPMRLTTDSIKPKGTTSPAGSSNEDPAVFNEDSLFRDAPPKASSLSHRVLEGHTGRVGCVAIHTDGATIASGSRDGTIRLWDLATARHLKTLEEHTAEVTSLAFQPGGTLLASGSRDRTIRLWDFDSGTKAGLPYEQADEVVSIAFHPDGNLLSFADMSGRVTAWDVDAAHALHVQETDLNFIYGAKFSPDGKMLAARGPHGFLTISDLGTETKRLTQLPNSPLGFSPDGMILAANRARNGLRVELSDTTTGRFLRTLQGHVGRVAGGRFSPDGRRLATVGWDRTIRLWDVATGKTVRTFYGHRGTIFAACFTPDGKTLVTGGADHTVRIWDLAAVE